ncbi:hypothetical protein O5282_26455 [Escherichia coli]|nr:hypothetical protein [Escherichia coli]
MSQDVQSYSSWRQKLFSSVCNSELVNDDPTFHKKRQRYSAAEMPHGEDFALVIGTDAL